MIEFRALNMAALKAYVESAAYQTAPAIAITQHRALSHAANPLLRPDDIVMILAYLGEEMVGYLGIMAYQATDRRGNTRRFGWMTCLWVSPKARGQRLTERFFQEAATHWDGGLMSADYVPFTAKLYVRSGVFNEHPVQREGIRLYVLSNFAQLLPPRGGAFAKTQPFLTVFDGILNLVLRPALLTSRWRKAAHQENFQAEELTTLDSEARTFIHLHSQEDTFDSGAEHLQWILDYPWILSQDQHQPIFDRYEFSSTALSFENQLYGLRTENDELCAILLFSLRDGHLKLPYLFCRKAELGLVINFINTCICRWKVSMFTTFHPDVVDALKTAKTPAFHKKSITRSYMVSKNLAAALGEIRFQDGDGDVAFT